MKLEDNLNINVSCMVLKRVVVDRWFPSSKTCSNCGYKKETLSLSERVFECESCNFTIDRDLNAAINLCKAVS